MSGRYFEPWCIVFAVINFRESTQNSRKILFAKVYDLKVAQSIILINEVLVKYEIKKMDWATLKYTKIKWASVNSEQIELVQKVGLAPLVQFANSFNLFPICTETHLIFV